ncbi:recombinase family protein [Sulfitobacter pontiacus]|uniref:recombinase family protein n=1 Tax=Sulfitobacter pontiacus TaxID=60137 RepID=UPI0030ECED7D
MIIVVHRLDPLSRSTPDVLNLVHKLDAKGASLRILEPEVTTAGDMTRMVITVLGMVTDTELKFIRDHQRAGIEAVKIKGVYKGGSEEGKQCGSSQTRSQEHCKGPDRPRSRRVPHDRLPSAGEPKHLSRHINQIKPANKMRIKYDLPLMAAMAVSQKQTQSPENSNRSTNVVFWRG